MQKISVLKYAWFFFMQKYNFQYFLLDFGVKCDRFSLDLPKIKIFYPMYLINFFTFNQDKETIISFSVIIVVFLDVNIGVFQLFLYYNHASDIVPCVSKINFQL